MREYKKDITRRVCFEASWNWRRFAFGIAIYPFEVYRCHCGLGLGWLLLVVSYYPDSEERKDE